MTAPTPVDPAVLLVSQHAHLEATFTAHLRALIERELEAATLQLQHFAQVLQAHLLQEEEIVLPVYSERGGLTVEVRAEVFAAEHRKLHKLLHELTTVLATLGSAPDAQQVLDYLDRALAFRRLLEHHDRREESLLYPWFERLTTPEERALQADAVQQPTSPAPRVDH
jgi:hemerythrin-like domain-containing protein